MIDIQQLASVIADKLTKSGFVEVEASARHVHLCRDDMEKLFGKGAGLTPVRDLSQKGEFLCKERVTIVTDRRTLQNVAVLGPLRPQSQVELSLTDGFSLGLKLPVRDSGNVEGTPGVLLRTDFGEVRLPYGCIVARRHLHATPEDARILALTDGELVSIEVFGTRKTTYSDVLVRVKEGFSLRVHLDMDEANAAGLDGFTLARIIK
jgi:putative phosphotransacetylase